MPAMDEYSGDAAANDDAFHGLTRHRRDEIEVSVVMDYGNAMSLRGGRDKEIGELCRAQLTALG